MLPKKVAGRYEIRSELGRGMMGVVYEAHDSTLGRLVALKTIQVSRAVSEEEREAFERRFVAEARVAARLSHPNIVTVHDVGRDPESGVLFMALEYLKGRTLAEVAADGPMPWRDALRVTASLADALRHAHASEIIHRDIKPANVMILPSGEPTIMDFGIAKVPASDLTADGQIFGSPSYMSPEQAMGQHLDIRSDIFSLGTVLYLILTGQAAFGGDTLPLIVTALMQEDPKAPSLVVPGTPQTVDAIVACALAKAREDRYPNGHALAEDIEDVLAGRSPRNAGRLGRAAGDETQVSLGPPLEESAQEAAPGHSPLPGAPGVAGGSLGSGGATPAPSPIAAARSPGSLGMRRKLVSPEGQRPAGASQQSSARLGRTLALVGAGLTLLGAGLVAGRLLTRPAAPPSAATSSPATPVPSSEAPAAAPETPSSAPTEVNDGAPAPEATPAPSPSPHAPAPLSSGRTAPDPDRAVEPPRAAPVAVPEEPDTEEPDTEEPDTETRPVRVRAEPAASTPPPAAEPAAAEAPAELFVDFEHALKEGYLRIWVDGVPVVDTDIEGRVKKKLVGLKWRKGHLEQTLAVSPGRHSIQVQVSWDDKEKTETISGRFGPGSQRILEVRLGRIRKNLDLEWR